MDIYHDLIIALIAASPLSELRGAIPLGLAVYHLPWLEVFFWAILGNLIPVILLLWLLPSISSFLSHRFYFFNRFFTWLFERTRRKHSRSFAIWGALAMVIFVAIPLPLTGAWSGVVAAFVFGIPWRRAFSLIFLGVFVAGIIVLLVSLGVLISL